MSMSISGRSIPMPTLPLQQDTHVTAQIINSVGGCWGATFSAPARRNTAVRFSDRGD